MIACSLDGAIICWLLHVPLKNMTFCTGNPSVIQQHYEVPLWITLKHICEWKEQKLWLLQKPPQTGCSVKISSMISSLVLCDWTLSLSRHPPASQRVAEVQFRHLWLWLYCCCLRNMTAVSSKACWDFIEWLHDEYSVVLAALSTTGLSNCLLLSSAVNLM